MKNLLLVVSLLVTLCTINAQDAKIELETHYGSENKELQDLMRFQGVETIKLNFSGADLIGKNYRVLIKEYTNGSLAQTDTIVDSATYSYTPAVQDSLFEFKYYVKMQRKTSIKMNFLFDRFSIERNYDIKANADAYALHDFLGGHKTIPIKFGTPTFLLGYFLPYIDEATGWKKYCEVSGSTIKPEDWGINFKIPNYFLVEIKFE